MTPSLPLARRALRVLQGAAGVLGARLLDRRRPLLVGWAVTNRCDLHCSYCDRPVAADRELTPEEALAVADDIGRSGVTLTNLSGGEPLLRADLGAIIEKLRDGGVMVSVCTNGRLLPRRLEEVRAANVLTVSIDGPEGVHDAQRGTGSFRSAVAGLEAARARGLRVRVHAVLTRHNLDSFDWFLDLGRAHHTALTFSPAQDFYLASPGVADMVPVRERYREFMDRAIAAREAGDDRLGDSVACLRYLRNWPDYQPIGCSAGQIFCRLEPDGALHSCGAVVADEHPVDVRQGLRRAFARLEPKGCKSCWCNTEVEMNLLYEMRLEALASALRTVTSVALGKQPRAAGVA
jgi:MoaA/NifB/PqqE/SkfB family radical SAM enzyme